MAAKVSKASSAIFRRLGVMNLSRYSTTAASRLFHSRYNLPKILYAKAVHNENRLSKIVINDVCGLFYKCYFGARKSVIGSGGVV